MEKMKILTEEQIDKIKRENRSYTLFLAAVFTGLSVFSWFTIDHGRYFLPTIFLFIIILFLVTSYIFRGNFVVFIDLEDEGFWIEKENGHEEFVSLKNIYKIFPMNASNRGGKALHITYLKDASSEGWLSRLTGFKRSIRDSILIPFELGKTIHHRWSEYYGDGRVFEGKEELDRWEKDLSKRYQIWLALWDIVTLSLVLSIVYEIVELFIQDSLYSILPFAIYTLIPILLGSVLVAVHIDHIRTKKKIDKLERKGAPELK